MARATRRPLERPCYHARQDRNARNARRALDAAALVAYGVLVNANRAGEFNRLMGTYIVVFFVVSQATAWACFGEHPSAPLLFGGALIEGGFVIQTGAH
jgi:drug/metabolite transporter (DMT)-like permease